MLFTQTGDRPLIISKNTILVTQDCTERSMTSKIGSPMISLHNAICYVTLGMSLLSLAKGFFATGVILSSTAYNLKGISKFSCSERESMAQNTKVPYTIVSSFSITSSYLVVRLSSALRCPRSECMHDSENRIFCRFSRLHSASLISRGHTAESTPGEIIGKPIAIYCQPSPTRPTISEICE